MEETKEGRAEGRCERKIGGSRQEIYERGGRGENVKGKKVQRHAYILCQIQEATQGKICEK